MVAEQTRRRLLREPLPNRLGALAADLARIASFSDNPANHGAVTSLLEEGKFFAEWIALDAPLETQAVLAELQVTLALWERRWRKGVEVPMLQAEAEQRSSALLSLAGLA